MALFRPTGNVVSQARPYPIILLLDTSSSMNWKVVKGGDESRIKVLNDSVAKMIDIFRQEQSDRAEFMISVITFGGDTAVKVQSQSVNELNFEPLKAYGGTFLGAGLELTKNLIEDTAIITRRGFRPMVILVSDGRPGDEWEKPLEDFIKNGRTSKCDRYALAVGKEADRNMLGMFIKGTNNELFEADNIEDIGEFFKFVTMSACSSVTKINAVKSQNTVGQPLSDNDDDDDDELY